MPKKSTDQATVQPSHLPVRGVIQRGFDDDSSFTDDDEPTLENTMLNELKCIPKSERKPEPV